MQNKLIIGGAVVVLAIIGYLIYSSPVNKELSQNGIVGDDPYEQNIATHSEDVYGEDSINASSSTILATTNKTTPKKMADTYTVKMETSKGNIVLELNSKIAPKTVQNFLTLTNQGFYNGVKFHRVIKDFMIQTGDPLSKDDSKMNSWGTGGPGYQFADEITDQATYQNGYKRGILAMANSGPNTNGSQFFIMHKDTPLPPSYTIFGHVVSGLDVVDAIANSKTANGDRPVENIVINKIIVE